MGHHSNKNNFQGARSWQSIRQDWSRRKALLLWARERYARSPYSFLGVFLLGLIGVLGAWWGWRSLALKERSVPVLEVDFQTSGVLTKAWAMKTLELPKQGHLMDLDLFSLKEKLESISQIKGAHLTRRFPRTLVIALEEYLPLLRLVVQEPGQPKAGYLVSEQGAVFEPLGYPLRQLQKLPFLGGLRVKKVAKGYQLNHSIAPVVDLVREAQRRYPESFRKWNQVICEYFDQPYLKEHGVIQVKTRAPNAQTLLFGLEDPAGQLARLHQVNLYSATHYKRWPVYVDLTSPDQAVIRYQ